MHTTDYTNYLLEKNDEIIIDTSSLMEVDFMSIFIDRAEDTLTYLGKKITVPASVQRELENHISGDNEEKKQKAIEVFRLMDNFYYLFNLDPKGIGEPEYIFADTDLLARLLLNKSDRTQLLIVNDRNLGKDAFHLNKQSSNYGKTIMVAFLNYNGYLCRCDCTKKVDETIEVTEQPAIQYIEKERIVYVDADKPQKAKKKELWKLPATFAGGFISGYIVKEYAVPFIKRAIA
ncbi:MAG: hypothetical protein IJN72_08025 [Firmicutes bacterium]|nr:hypothetical protein [Bacillota bacterium]